MFRPLIAFALVATAAPASAATPRELITQAAFQTTDKKQALALVEQAFDAATGPSREAQLQRAFAVGYRAKLTRSPGDAKAARKLFEGLVAANPRDPEAQLALGGWHLDAIAEGFLAASVLGAKRAEGVAGLDRAVALGGNRAFFRGFAAMMHIRLDPRDLATARALAEAAITSPTPTALDRLAKRDAEVLLGPLRAGDGKGAAAMARAMLPFGRVK
jgi:hypothetical protein